MNGNFADVPNDVTTKPNRHRLTGIHEICCSEVQAGMEQHNGHRLCNYDDNDNYYC